MTQALPAVRNAVPAETASSGCSLIEQFAQIEALNALVTLSGRALPQAIKLVSAPALPPAT